MTTPQPNIDHSIPWTLNHADLELGDKIATARIAYVKRRRLTDRRGNIPNGGHNGHVAHYRGAWAEIVVARYLNIPVPKDACRFHNKPDLDPDIEVRWNKDGQLIIRDTDRVESSRFVLVTGDAPKLTLVGWISGADLRWDWRTDRHGYGEAWFVPADALRPMPELRDKIKNP